MLPTWVRWWLVLSVFWGAFAMPIGIVVGKCMAVEEFAELRKRERGQAALRRAVDRRVS